jgi:chitodextrinase
MAPPVALQPAAPNQYNNNPYMNGPYGQTPFYNSPNGPGYNSGYGQGQPGYDAYGNPLPYGGQPYPGLGSPNGGYNQTLTVVAPPNGIVSLNWVATPNVLSYRIYDTLISQPLNFSVAQTVNQSAGMLATNALVAGLTPGATYLIQVRAVGFSGQETVAPAASTGLPGFGTPGYGPLGLLAPVGLSVSGLSASTSTLTWPGITGPFTYRVFQATSPSGPFSPSVVGPMTGTGTTVIGLNPTTTYFFQVIAQDAQGNQSPPSNTATWTSTSVGLAAPTSLSMSGMTATTAMSNWVAVPSAASYRLSQSQSLNGPFTASATVYLTTTEALVTGLLPNTTYYFQVSAVDATGNPSLASNTAMGLTTP